MRDNVKRAKLELHLESPFGIAMRRFILVDR